MAAHLGFDILCPDPPPKMFVLLQNIGVCLNNISLQLHSASLFLICCLFVRTAKEPSFA